jgi:hypothetical protein
MSVTAERGPGSTLFPFGSTLLPSGAARFLSDPAICAAPALFNNAAFFFAEF